MKIYALMIVTLLPAALLTACGRGMRAVSVANLSSQTMASNQNLLANQATLTITDPTNGEVIYSDAYPDGSLDLRAGHRYDLQLSGVGLPDDTTYELRSLSIDSVGSVTQNTLLKVGHNTFSVPDLGDYIWKLVITPPGVDPATQSYIAEVSCDTPSFTQKSLKANGITVSPVGNANLYNFSAAGVITTADGVPPYTCYLDPTGTGIIAIGPQDCSTVFNNVYVNYMGARNVGVMVKDACNTTYTVSHPVNLASTQPALGGSTSFVEAIFSAALGWALGDARVDGVHYLATNVGDAQPVHASYGDGSFTVSAVQNYHRPSSLDFGVEVKVTGLKDTLNLSQGSGAVDISAAKIDHVTYTTDQLGDQLAPLTLTSTDCTLNQTSVQVSFSSGANCSKRRADIKLSGHYHCTLSNEKASSSSQIDGKFTAVATLNPCAQGSDNGLKPLQL